MSYAQRWQGSSRPYAITWTDHNIAAIMDATHNRQEQGHALANLLFGDYSPVDGWDEVVHRYVVEEDGT